MIRTAYGLRLVVSIYIRLDQTTVPQWLITTINIGWELHRILTQQGTFFISLGYTNKLLERNPKVIVPNLSVNCSILQVSCRYDWLLIARGGFANRSLQKVSVLNESSFARPHFLLLLLLLLLMIDCSRLSMVIVPGLLLATVSRHQHLHCSLLQ